MKILLTAFDAFGADALNPTEQILPSLAELFAGTDVVLTTCVLPTSFSRALRGTEIGRRNDDLHRLHRRRE